MPGPFDELPDRRDAPTWAHNLGRIEPLQARLGRVFARPALLRVALTHPTWANEHVRSGWPSNAALEFFGDAVLDLLATEALWRRFPGQAEGVLTWLHAAVVSEPALAAAARGVDLGPLLWIGHDKPELRDHDGALADAAEAILGAAFLDAREAGTDPLAAAGAVFEALLGARVAALGLGDGKPAKSRLQEWVQARPGHALRYAPLVDRAPGGPAGWRVAAEVTGPEGQVIARAEGEGPGRRAAEGAAAEAALAQLAGRP